MTGNYTKVMLQAHPTCYLTEISEIKLSNKLKKPCKLLYKAFRFVVPPGLEPGAY